MKKIIVTMAILLIAGLLAPYIATAGATTPAEVQGNWIGTSLPVATNNKIAGANLFSDVQNFGLYKSGSIIGIFNQNFKVADHLKSPKLMEQYIADGTPFNQWVIQSFEWTQMVRVFTGAVKIGDNTYSGGFTMLLRATGTGNNLKAGDPWTLEGTWTIIEGSGGLAGLHGQGTWWHYPGITGLAYKGQVHIE